MSEKAIDVPADDADVIADDTAEALDLDALEGPTADEAEADESDAPESDDADDPDADDGEDDGETVKTRVFSFGSDKLELPADAVPPELADKIEAFTKGTWADYTKKSQANADVRKDLAARAEAHEKISALSGEALQTFSTGLHLKNEIEQLSRVNLNQLWQSDPDQARAYSDALAQKQAQLQNIINLVAKQEQAADEAQRQEAARRAEAGKAEMEAYAKGFEATIAPQVMDYVVESSGMSREDAEKWALNPAVTKWAHKAMLYDRMQAAKAKPADKRPAKPVRSMKSAGGNSGGARDPEKMNMSQLAKHLGLA